MSISHSIRKVLKITYEFTFPNMHYQCGPGILKCTVIGMMPKVNEF